MGKSKIKAEEKIRIVISCVNGELGQSEAASQIVVNHTVVADWVRQYQAEGIEAFTYRERNRAYSPEKKGSRSKYIPIRGRKHPRCLREIQYSLNFNAQKLDEGV